MNAPEPPPPNVFILYWSSLEWSHKPVNLYYMQDVHHNVHAAQKSSMERLHVAQLADMNRLCI